MKSNTLEIPNAKDAFSGPRSPYTKKGAAWNNSLHRNQSADNLRSPPSSFKKNIIFDDDKKETKIPESTGAPNRRVPKRNPIFQTPFQDTKPVSSTLETPGSHNQINLPPKPTNRKDKLTPEEALFQEMKSKLDASNISEHASVRS